MLNLIEFRESDHVVVLSSDKKPFAAAIEELQHADARRMALREASRRGFPDAGCGFSASPYPVDADGKVVEDPINQTIAGYRTDITITPKP